MIPAILGLGGLTARIVATAVIPRVVRAISSSFSTPKTIEPRRPLAIEGISTAPEPAPTPVLSGVSAPLRTSRKWGYAGLWHHQAPGLDLATYRAYDAANKRWISRDPLGEGVDTNLYRYCGNSPINLTDPSGLLPEWVEAIVETIAKPAKSVYEVFGPIESDLTKPAPPNPSPSGASGFLLRNTLRGIPGVMICPTKVGDGTLKGNGIKTVKDLIDTSKPGRATKGRATQYERTGGMDAANADFDSLGLSDVTTAPNGTRIGRLPDGRTVNVRGQSTAGTPTLEIQGTSSTLKFRYGP